MLFALIFLVVRRHYAESLPHFDSMGSFTLVWQTMNIVEASGYREGLAFVAGTSTGWLQPLFALLVAGWPFRTPEAVVVLNVGLLLLTQLAIVNYGRAHGFSPHRQLVMVALPALPAVASSWQGGFQDFRRDSQLVILTTGVLFQALAYAERPTTRNGLYLGLLCGLLLWSRDNSAPTVVLMVLPAAAVSVWRGVAAGGLAGLGTVVGRACVPAAIFLALLIPYYALTLGLTWNRYTTNVWGFGNDRLQSLWSSIDAPYAVVLGARGRYGGTTPEGTVLTVALLLFLAGVAIAARRPGWIRLQPGRLRTRPYLLLIGAGVAAMLSVLIFNALVVGIRAITTGISYLPMASGSVAIIAGLLGIVSRGQRTTRLAVVGLPVLACASIMMVAVVRMLPSPAQQPTGNESVAAFRQIALDFGAGAAGRPIAILWTEDFSRHHLDFYLTQAGYPRMVDFATLATERGYQIDLDQPLRPGDQPAVLQERLDYALHTYADFAVVCLETEQYEDSKQTRLWPYIVGRPVVERLLQDPSFTMIRQFTIGSRTFALLENRRPFR